MVKNHYVVHQDRLKSSTFEESPCAKTWKTHKNVIYKKNVTLCSLKSVKTNCMFSENPCANIKKSQNYLCLTIMFSTKIDNK